jgi:hypothetical protein
MFAAREGIPAEIALYVLGGHEKQEATTTSKV